MQDEDGGVWHKQTSERFPGFVMPEQDKLVSYVVGSGTEPFKTSCATGDLAAVMAIAGRVYKPFDAGFAERNLRAAEKAWTWLGKYPNVTFRNPQAVSTGGYGDGNCADEALWAAAELWRTHGRRRVSEVLPGALCGVQRVDPGDGAAIVAERGQPRAVDVRIGRRQGRGSRGRDSQGVADGGGPDCGAHQGERVPAEPDVAGLYLGIERGGGELRNAVVGGECIRAQAGVCGGRAG